MIFSQSNNCVSANETNRPYQKKTRKAYRHDKTKPFFLLFPYQKKAVFTSHSQEVEPKQRTSATDRDDTTVVCMPSSFRIEDRYIVLLRTATGRYVYTQIHVLVPRCQVYRRVFVRI